MGANCVCFKRRNGQCIQRKRDAQYEWSSIYPERGVTYTGYAKHVYDGDTFTFATIFNGHPTKLKIRMHGYDASEIRPVARKSHTYKLAILAKERLTELLDYDQIEVKIVSHDKYFGRYVAVVKTPHTQDISARMVAEGHGVPYYGRGRRVYDFSHHPVPDNMRKRYEELLLQQEE
jgi:endonuclease YncB( thermonuclease family)